MEPHQGRGQRRRGPPGVQDGDGQHGTAKQDRYVTGYRCIAFRGFAKLEFQKLKKNPQKNWIGLTTSTHPHQKFSFGNPSQTLT